MTYASAEIRNGVMEQRSSSDDRCRSATQGIRLSIEPGTKTPDAESHREYRCGGATKT
ncbi:MAG: hypothetical protein M9953_08870 [Thermomicrobiales bacterium]|nr:hypothetical protein [Thermomicrobiales bacterium]MCO5225435.1 hypothetical protein [Thermomicrobiales bacterium]MCO5228991.1 hypothetical protein [Thermomicrobiales bacterium]